MFFTLFLLIYSSTNLDIYTISLVRFGTQGVSLRREGRYTLSRTEPLRQVSQL